MRGLFAQPAVRPKEIKRAEWLLWAWTAWICIYGVYQTMSGASGADAMLGQELQSVIDIPPESMRTVIIIAYIAVAVSMAAVVAQIGRGRRWARVSLLISFVFEILLFSGPQESGVTGYLTLIPDLGLQSVALYLLYTKPGRDWFAKKSRA